MNEINFIGRALTGITAFGFLFAGIFDVLDNFIIKIFLFASFFVVVVYMFLKLFENKNHP